MKGKKEKEKKEGEEPDLFDTQATVSSLRAAKKRGGGC